MRADGAKSDADGKYVESQRDGEGCFGRDPILAQKKRFDDQINALMAKKGKADNDAIDAAEKVQKAEGALVQASFEYHQKLLHWCSKNSCCLARQSCR